ncbi:MULTISPECIES: MupG family TIM beta-alpha barrel fold protein [unclassified Streptomyces]|uniref:MupG family TIM beta-alpha barrel fold protein n=1 Tax=unclassified Streptomyces TaxID=2593676 RepID=UPI00278C2B98|nr:MULTISPECIES: MupG family TIM beta-alpha barrel fold protein [unclassified Streptomyces]
MSTSGISLYLAHLDVAAAACAQAQRLGATEAFASLHMPEDDPATFAAELRDVSALAHDHGLRLTVDISQNSLPALGLTPETADGLKAYGVDAIRVDFGLPDEAIAAISRVLPLQLNASTIGPDWLAALLKAGLRTDALTASHNFYPRRHTGISRELLAARNEMWHAHGIPVSAFAPGDGVLRAPVHAGLPTLEAHRAWHPLAAALDLAALGCDTVHIGDPLLADRTVTQWRAWNEDAEIDLTVHLRPGTPPPVLAHLTSSDPDRERTDPAEELVRLENSRPALRAEPTPAHDGPPEPRPRGTLTLGNDELPRYRGELSLTRTDLPPDPTVNVLGTVPPAELPLLDLIGPGTPVRLTPA